MAKTDDGRETEFKPRKRVATVIVLSALMLAVAGWAAWKTLEATPFYKTESTSTSALGREKAPEPRIVQGVDGQSTGEPAAVETVTITSEDIADRYGADDAVLHSADGGETLTLPADSYGMGVVINDGESHTVQIAVDADGSWQAIDLATGVELTV